jgi:type II secretory pathway predicted ATPase ExeA
MPRFFNTTGPCDPNDHYLLPPERRLTQLTQLIAEKRYFVLHAPRQTGKTTAMRSLTARLNGEGYVALTATLETSQGVADVEQAERSWMDAIRLAADFDLPPDQQPPQAVDNVGPGNRLLAFLRSWCAHVKQPVVLVLDEADVVRDAPLISLLRQLRAGFSHRGAGRFPVSVALVGLRDLRDYLVQAKDGAQVNPGSPFNIKAESLTLRNFHADEVRELLLQHTAETGQPWTDEAIERVWERTQGQPFLVNALAWRATSRLVQDRAVTLDLPVILEAEQQLILSRTTHLDNLTERLKEPRVARVIEPVILGDEALDVDAMSDDLEYTRDLGLIRRGPQGLEIANPMYREVLIRQLTATQELSLPQPTWPWRTPEGRLNVPALVQAFLTWWRRDADILRTDRRTPYLEAAAHLAFMGFLQRVVNGGGTVEREYAAARGRVDVVVHYAGERHVFELKRVRERIGLQTVIDEGLEQLAGYLDTLGLSEGWLIIFDTRPRSWEEKLWTREERRDGKLLHLRGA